MTLASGFLQSRVSALAEEHGFAVRLPGGGMAGDASRAAFVIAIRDWRALGSLDPLSVGRAWVEGGIDLEGDIFAAMEVLHGLEAGPTSLATGFLGTLRRATARVRDARADIAAHYEAPVAFFRTFLDERLVYTCACFRHDDETLERAQERKLDLACRKLRLAPGHELLDLGCGWGALALWAAAHYGARVHAVTLAPSQAVWAADAARAEGLADRVQVECLDWQDLPQGRRYDRIASIGMLEHVPRSRHPALFRMVAGRLERGGLFLNHAITMRRGATWSMEMEFLHRYVFPGLDLVDISATLSAAEDSGLEVLDVENLRPHYERTTRIWAERLWERRAEAVAAADERTWRTWVAYLAAASVSFRRGWIGLHQSLLRRAGEDGVPLLPREDIYAPGSVRR